MDTDHESPTQMVCISLFEDNVSRWEAVKDRNAIADGLFFCASAKTKVYCRPVCKTRLPYRANVSFYKTSKEAQTAGYRPCKRCRPDHEGIMPEDAAVLKVQAFLEGRKGFFGDGSTQESLSQMARQAGLSKWHFHRVFKKHTGMTPVQYVRLGRRSVAKIHGDIFSDDFAFTDLLDRESKDSTPLLDSLSILENSTAGGFSEGQSENKSNGDPQSVFWSQVMEYSISELSEVAEP